MQPNSNREVELESLDIHISPNPATDQVSITGNHARQISEIELVSVLGGVIRRWSGYQSGLDLGGISSAMYVLRFHFDDAEVMPVSLKLLI